LFGFPLFNFSTVHIRSKLAVFSSRSV